MMQNGMSLHLLDGDQELNGGGYAPRNITEADWKEDGDDYCFEHTFDFTGHAGDARGYEIRHQGDVIARDVFEEPFPIRIKGDKVTVKAYLGR